jgi:hypothetical protein
MTSRTSRTIRTGSGEEDEIRKKFRRIVGS